MMNFSYYYEIVVKPETIENSVEISPTTCVSVVKTVSVVKALNIFFVLFF